MEEEEDNGGERYRGDNGRVWVWEGEIGKCMGDKEILRCYVWSVLSNVYSRLFQRVLVQDGNGSRSVPWL